MLSVILNIITLLFVSAFVVLFYLVYYRRKNKDDTATDVLIDMLKDPLIVSRAYFTEPIDGPLGDFEAYDSVPEDHWLHGFPHKEA